MVRIKVPSGVTHISTIDGEQHMVQDGHVTVLEENAVPLMCRGI
jgi:hypothetical protein